MEVNAQIFLLLIFSFFHWLNQTVYDVFFKTEVQLIYRYFLITFSMARIEQDTGNGAVNRVHVQKTAMKQAARGSILGVFLNAQKARGGCWLQAAKGQARPGLG